MNWNPQQYLKFGGERVRPVLDLLARLPLESPRTVADLGCGAGNVTALLRARWPQARITGIDSSSAMLDKARAAVSGVDWQAADLARWSPSEPVDLLFSNAALHWLDDHAQLFPRLASHVHEGGALAVQMPAQHDAPSHRIGYEIADHPRWRDRLQPLSRRHAVHSTQAYYAMLRPHVSSLEIWTTEYLQALGGDNPVAEFTKGSFVGVWLAALEQDEASAFEAQYRAAIEKAYPKRDDGITLFPFRRLFIVAQR